MDRIIDRQIVILYSIIMICRVSGEATSKDQDMQTDREKESASPDALLEESNPFLAKLLKTYLPDDPEAAAAAKTLAEDLGETEKAIRRRMKDTMKAATTVLQLIEDMKDGKQLQEDAGVNARLSALVEVLKAENNKLKAQAPQESIALRDAEAKIADKEAEMLVLHRKIIQSQEGAIQQDISMISNKDHESQLKISRAPSVNQLPGAADDGKLLADLEARTREVEERDRLLASAERYGDFCVVVGCHSKETGWCDKRNRRLTHCWVILRDVSLSCCWVERRHP